MNVVIAALSAPVQMNGVSRHGENLIRALLSTNEVSSVHFLAGDWQKEMFRSAFAGVDARLHPHWIRLRDANLSRLVWYYDELPEIATQLEADIVHLTFPAPTAMKAFQCPTVLSLHDFYAFDIPRNFGLLRSVLARYTIKQCLARVNAIACVSCNTRAQLTKRYPLVGKKSVVIPNVVELRAPAAETGRLEALRGHPFMFCVAQHRSNKNVPLTIEVFERLLQERIVSIEARLVVVGIRGPETEKIEATIREAGLGNRVLLYSGLSDGEMRWCYENCEILLAPSSTEGFGLPIAEGMLAGSRIVCSDIPVFRELGGETCHYVSPRGDPVASYVDAIREALATPRPRGISLPQLSPTSVGRQYADLYASLVCSPRADTPQLRQPEPAKDGPIGARLQ